MIFETDFFCIGFETAPRTEVHLQWLRKHIGRDNYAITSKSFYNSFLDEIDEKELYVQFREEKYQMLYLLKFQNDPPDRSNTII